MRPERVSSSTPLRAKFQPSGPVGVVRIRETATCTSPRSSTQPAFGHSHSPGTLDFSDPASPPGSLVYIAKVSKDAPGGLEALGEPQEVPAADAPVPPAHVRTPIKHAPAPAEHAPTGKADA